MINRHEDPGLNMIKHIFGVKLCLNLLNTCLQHVFVMTSRQIFLSDTIYFQTETLIRIIHNYENKIEGKVEEDRVGDFLLL